jgi:hypothetical protein
MNLRALLHSRAMLVMAIAVAVTVPAVTLPRLPHVSPWPVLLGLLPWVVGKYLLCPLRWRVLTNATLSRWWHIRAYAESELLGLFTPGHVGADLWRLHRLRRVGLGRGDALTSVGVDRLVGAVALAIFVGLAGATLPLRLLLGAVCMALVLLTAFLIVRKVRPDLVPSRPLPPPRKLALGLLMSLGYQLTIAGFLLGAVAATGNSLSPLALLGAFGASQLAGALPGPNGAAPRDGALVLALVALGIPWAAAAAAVTLRTVLTWLPALALGGVSLLITRRAVRHAAMAAA